LCLAWVPLLDARIEVIFRVTFSDNKGKAHIQSKSQEKFAMKIDLSLIRS
jgi:hypothetical protein